MTTATSGTSTAPAPAPEVAPAWPPGAPAALLLSPVAPVPPATAPAVGQRSAAGSNNELTETGERCVSGVWPVEKSADVASPSPSTHAIQLTILKFYLHKKYKLKYVKYKYFTINKYKSIKYKLKYVKYKYFTINKYKSISINTHRLMCLLLKVSKSTVIAVERHVS